MKERNTNYVLSAPIATTSPNQRVVITMDAPEDGQFFKINKEEYRKACKLFKKKFTPTLYLELVGNKLFYPTALSSSNLIKEYGISRDAYTAAFNELVQTGFLVKEEGSHNRYLMYRNPPTVGNSNSSEEKTNCRKNQQLNVGNSHSQLLEKPAVNCRELPQEIDKINKINKIDSIVPANAKEEARKKLEEKGIEEELFNIMYSMKSESVWETKGYGLMFTPSFQSEAKAKQTAVQAEDEVATKRAQEQLAAYQAELEKPDNTRVFVRGGM